MEVLEGKIQNIVFRNEEDGFTILKTDNDTVVTCKGMINPVRGVAYTFSGGWGRDKWGTKFIAETAEESIPQKPIDIINYLSSGLVKNIGPVYARAIVEYFGAETFKVLDSKSKELLKVKGIGKGRAESIWKSWAEHKNIRELVSFLHDLELPVSFAVKVYRRYGNSAIEDIKEDPYRLLEEMDGVGFEKVDALALRLGIEPTNTRRCEAGVMYILSGRAEAGDTYCEKQHLFQWVSELLGVSCDVIAPVISEMCDKHTLVDDGEERIFKSSLWYAEQRVATKIRKILAECTIGVSCNIDTIQKVTGLEYDDVQKNGIKTVLNSGVSVVTGGPGTGKTTILKAVIEALKSAHYKIAAAAPTGKAAKRIKEVTGVEASTIHRLLGYIPGEEDYEYNNSNFLHYDAIILDEASMINIQLMDVLLDAVSPTTKLIIVGDVDQLPPIGPGNVLSDIIASGVVPTVKLTKIYRQAEGSDIIVNAHRINSGQMPAVLNSKPGTDFFFIESSPATTPEMIADLLEKRLPAKYDVPSADIQVICPKKAGTCGINNLNKVLQRRLNPTGIQITFGDTVFRIGDRIMQTKNNYDKNVFNGETGIITSIDPMEKIITSDFDGRTVQYMPGDFNEIVLCYAMTIHKSQGSEFPIVIIPIFIEAYNMLERNLLYTAVTRAKNICLIVGMKEMIRKAVETVTSVRRNTNLKEKLMGGRPHE